MDKIRVLEKSVLLHLNFSRFINSKQETCFDSRWLPLQLHRHGQCKSIQILNKTLKKSLSKSKTFFNGLLTYLSMY